MISFISGTIKHIEKHVVTIHTAGGVGYDIGLTGSHAAELTLGAGVELYTYMKVSDTAMDLYGFRTTRDRAFFSLLLSVSGVGPKSAMNILAIGSISDIEDAIAREDAKYLSAVQGIGKKTAERMVVELKSKVHAHRGASAVPKHGDAFGEVIDALVSMGYSKEEVKDVVSALPPEQDTESLLRLALKQLST